jgi:ubiquinone/menaquinone biosynthesis C-methylase UbiE
MDEERQTENHQGARVVDYYDTHPINEHEILAKLRARGVDVDALTELELKDFDQDHYGGTAAVDALAALADIGPQDAVLDVCSGMGGPARWLAYRIGCSVTGLDLTASRVESARRLTARAGLAERVRFEQGDATAMPFSAATFDAVIGQEAWVHVPDKAALVAECRRVLRPGGRVAFTDIVVRAPLSAAEANQMAEEMQFHSLIDPARYRGLLEAGGFRVVREDDLSAEWTRILVDRLEMYRSLRDTTVERFGQAHFERWDRMYGAFVGLNVAGKLGGVRFLATAPG